MHTTESLLSIRTVLGLLFVAASAVSSASSDIPSCDPREEYLSVCGLHAPEDLMFAPDGESIIFGQMQGPGGLLILDLESHTARPLFNGAVASGQALWGEPACTKPPQPLLAHGIDVQARNDGVWQVLVVNHGERESVEMFELSSDTGEWQAIWRGCAIAPDSVGFNDVAALKEGGFLVTNMADPAHPNWTAVQATLGIDTGEVHHWTKEQGFKALENTSGRYPNGIVMAPDGDSFYVNMYFENAIKQFSYPGAQLIAQADVEKPDNANWSEDGSRLLIASHHGNILAIAASLSADHSVPSLLPYAIEALDPATMETQRWLYHEGEPMGAATAAIQRGGALYLGSYTGDRIVRMLLDQRQ